MRTVNPVVGMAVSLAATTALILTGAGAAQASSAPVKHSPPTRAALPTVTRIYAHPDRVKVGAQITIYGRVSDATHYSTMPVSYKGKHHHHGHHGYTNGDLHGTAKIYFQAADPGRDDHGHGHGMTAASYHPHSILMGTATVSPSGQFSRSFTAVKSGNWWAVYSGNESTKWVNGRQASTSNTVFVKVRNHKKHYDPHHH